jgi:predicted aspartyl protease
MFIKAKVNGLNANMLVDTGATVSLVSISKPMSCIDVHLSKI